MIPAAVFKAFKTNRGQIVDPSAHMPHIDVGALAEGGDKSLATLYLIRALREDLQSLERNRIKVTDTIIGTKRERSPLDTSSLFLYQQHRALRALLMDTVVESRCNNVWNMLNRNNVDMWQEKNGDWMLKCSETNFLCRVT